MIKVFSNKQKSLPPQPITWSPQGLILNVGNQLSYEYDQGLLRLALKDKNIQWRYNYDEFLNMISWHGLGLFEVMKYDSDWDRIVYLKDANNCRFHFRYQIENTKKYIVETEKCLREEVRESLFEVVHPKLLIKAPTDILSKEFRKNDLKRSTANVEIF